MAGAGYKLFNTGDVLTAAQVNTYLQEQTVMVFASAAARTTALSGVLAEGMMSYLSDTDLIQYYNGTTWTTVNTDQTPLTTKGDLFTYSTTDTRLGVGADYTILQALASTSTGLQYAGDLVTYTPTWTASTTNPVIGNGTLVGKYLRIGKMCYVRIRLQIGSTTTTGSGSWRFALPFTAQTNSLNDGAPTGGYAEDNGVAGYRIVACAIPSAGTYVEPQNGTGNSSYTPTVPFTWGNTDYLQFAFVYEVA